MATARKSAARVRPPQEAAPVPAPSEPAAGARPAAKAAAKAARSPKAAALRDAATLAGAPKKAGRRAPAASKQFEVTDAANAELTRVSKVIKGHDTAVPAQVGGLTPVRVAPHYWEAACADLVGRDRILKKLIPQFGPVHLITRGDPFVTLARSIVGQQISVKAAQAVWNRIEDACPGFSPPPVIALGHDRLAACGLSKRKTEYILDLARHFQSDALHVDTWASMEDDAVIAELTQIRGIGRWTAEMFLIFNLMRPNVLPLDDAGLIRAISVNYFSGEPVTRSEAREVAANWEPWRTVATWYMWRSLEPLPVDY